MAAEPDLAELIEAWALTLRARNRSPRTIGSYLETALQFYHWLEGEGRPTVASEVTTRDVERWIAHLLDTRSTSTARLRYRSLQQLWRYSSRRATWPYPRWPGCAHRPPRNRSCPSWAPTTFASSSPPAAAGSSLIRRAGRAHPRRRGPRPRRGAHRREGPPGTHPAVLPESRRSVEALRAGPPGSPRLRPARLLARPGPGRSPTPGCAKSSNGAATRPGSSRSTRTSCATHSPITSSPPVATRAT